MTVMMSVLKDNPVTNFSRGFFYPFRAGRFLLSHPALLRFVVFPFLINTLIFSLCVYFGFDFFDGLVAKYIPQGDAWYWLLLSYAVWILAVLVTIVLVFFSFTVVGNLIASPFNDLLSEKTEQILTGVREEGAFALKAFLQDTKRVVATEIKKIGLFLVGMLLLLLLNILPVVGGALYAVLAFLLTLFFLVVEYLGYILERKRFTFARQREYIMTRKFLMLGFGTGVMAVLAIPFLQFLCIPLGVVGGTLLWFDLEDNA